jgi:hypothetical protein
VTTLNAATMARYREQMRRFYYDPTRYRSYLEQLGVAYPTVREGAAARRRGGRRGRHAVATSRRRPAGSAPRALP